METCCSGPKVTLMHPKTTGEGWDPERLVFLMLRTLFCMHKTAGEVWNPPRLVILVPLTMFCVHKATGEVWDP